MLKAQKPAYENIGIAATRNKIDCRAFEVRASGKTTKMTGTMKTAATTSWYENSGTPPSDVLDADVRVEAELCAKLLLTEVVEDSWVVVEEVNVVEVVEAAKVVVEAAIEQVVVAMRAVVPLRGPFWEISSPQITSRTRRSR